MRHEHRIPAKALSFLLALVMLVGCISVGFTAFAVEDTYQVLADAMRAEGMAGVIPRYKVSSSPDVKNKLTPTDPNATSAVYVHSIAMWDAMDAFWKIAGSLRSKDVGDITVGDNTSTPPGWGFSATSGFDAVSGWGVPDGPPLVGTQRAPGAAAAHT